MTAPELASHWDLLLALCFSAMQLLLAACTAPDRETTQDHDEIYACHTAYPSSRSPIANSTSISRAASYGIGLKHSYSSGIRRRPYSRANRFAFSPALCLSKRTSGDCPVMPT